MKTKTNSQPSNDSVALERAVRDAYVDEVYMEIRGGSILMFMLKITFGTNKFMNKVTTRRPLARKVWKKGK